MLKRSLIAFSPLLLAGGASIVLAAPGLSLIGVVGSAAVAWLLSGGRDGGFAALGLTRPPNPGRAVVVGVVAAAATWGAIIGGSAIGSLFFGPPNLEAFASLQGNLAALAIALVVSWANGAFAEEILFRGFLFRGLGDALGGGRRAWAVAAVGTSILFGLGHIYQGGAGVIGTALAGLVYCLAVLALRGNLWGAVIGHGLFDTAAFTWVYFHGVAG